MKKLAFCLSLSLIVHAFVFSQVDTVFNQMDDQGMKQGHWKKNYPNDKLMYQGFFKNNKPVGLMKRYHESGGIKAAMNFDDSGESCSVTLFYEDGERSAEGFYYGMKKDSCWKYYSYYSGTVVSEENYTHGQKDGVFKTYYSNQNLSEEIEYKNDVKEGIWNQYFEDGKLRFKTTYRYNAINGRYTFYYPNGIMMMTGTFDNNKKDGIWVYYKDDGQEKYRLTYNYGELNAADQQKMVEQDEEFFKMIDDNIGKFKEPSINDFMQGGPN